MYSILEEADKIIEGEKRDEYGSTQESFNAIANIWNGILRTGKSGITITPQDVALMMIGLKLYREGYKHKIDNLVDIVGYTKCLGHLNGIKE